MDDTGRKNPSLRNYLGHSPGFMHLLETLVVFFELAGVSVLPSYSSTRVISTAGCWDNALKPLDHRFSSFGLAMVPPTVEQ